MAGNNNLCLKQENAQCNLWFFCMHSFFEVTLALAVMVTWFPPPTSPTVITLCPQDTCMKAEVATLLQSVDYSLDLSSFCMDVIILLFQDLVQITTSCVLLLVITLLCCVIVFIWFFYDFGSFEKQFLGILQYVCQFWHVRCFHSVLNRDSVRLGRQVQEKNALLAHPFRMQPHLHDLTASTQRGSLELVWSQCLHISPRKVCFSAAVFSVSVYQDGLIYLTYMHIL